jgi:hypothetical protein
MGPEINKINMMSALSRVFVVRGGLVRFCSPE